MGGLFGKILNTKKRKRKLNWRIKSSRRGKGKLNPRKGSKARKKIQRQNKHSLNSSRSRNRLKKRKS